ncbi:MAG: hypothetical protein PHF21_04490 [Bacilli bacterium]|nr:hypothetical protein [Bacilli bacterium]
MPETILADTTAVLGVLKEIALFFLGMISDVVEVVMSNPLLLIPIGVVMLYTVINVFKKLF